MAQDMKVTPIAPGRRPVAGHPEELTIVGKGIPVRDAVEKVTGSLTFAVDFAVQDMVYGKVLRSPHPHARITRIDTRRAEALSGVLGVVTYHDAPAGIWENAWFNYRGKILDDTVRFVGDDVAAVAAETAEIAENALDLIEVEYELLPAVFDPDEAREPGAPQVHPEGNERPAYVVEWGDVAIGEAEADFVVEADIRFESQQMACIGRNACIASWKGDKLTVWVSSQTPSEVRDGLHESFEIPFSKIRVIALPVGSSFGLWWSGNFIMLTALMARKAQRPVKIELTNEECFSAVKRRHKEHTRGRAGCTKDGTLTFTQFDHVIDNGGYGFKDDVGFFCVDMWGRAHHGHWAIHGVNTNLCTAGCMRAVGDMTLGSVIERLADQLAQKVGMDPVDFRLKNQITAGDELRMQHSRMNMKGTLEDYVDSIPVDLRHHWPEMFHLSSGGTKDILARGSEAFRWKRRWQGWGVPTAADGPIRRGVGIGTGCHVCGVEFEGATSAVVRINPDGSAQVAVNCGRQGQGSETTLSQIAAETLGIPFELIEIETGDTDSGPWSHGSLASNTIYRIGWAVWAAGLDARRQLLEIASREFFEGVDVTELTVGEGLVRRRCHERASFGQSRADLVHHRQTGDANAAGSRLCAPLRRALRRGRSGCGDGRGEARRLPRLPGQRHDREPPGHEEPGNRRSALRRGIRPARASGVRPGGWARLEPRLPRLQSASRLRLPDRRRGPIRQLVRPRGAVRSSRGRGGPCHSTGTGDLPGCLQRDGRVDRHAADARTRAVGTREDCLS